MSSHQANRRDRRKRKSRTEEVSSPSSSSGESESPPSPEQNDAGNQSNDNTMNVGHPNQADETAASEQQDQTINAPPKPTDPEQAFDEFYLKQATKEFSSDLDKLRSAGDFNEKSVPMIIEALKQGRACFSAEERRKIGDASS